MSAFEWGEQVASLRDACKQGTLSEAEYRAGLEKLMAQAGATASGGGVERNAVDAEAACELRDAQATLERSDAARRKILIRMRLRTASASAGSSPSVSNPTLQRADSAEPAQLATPQVQALSPEGANPPKLSELKLAKVLGTGAFGTVYLALRKGVGSFVAIKRIVFPPGTHPSEVQKVVNEVRIMKQLSGHPHVVRYIGAEKREEPKTGNRVLHIMMEYVSGGPLSAVSNTFSASASGGLEDGLDGFGGGGGGEGEAGEGGGGGADPEGGGGLDEDTVRSYVVQIVRGLRFLHSSGIAHRDVKGENVLVGTDGCVKLADFGTASMIESCGRDVVGTPWFMAPEVVRSPEQQTGGHDSKADIWSLGATVIQLLTGSPPLLRQLPMASACMYAVAKGVAQPLDDMPTSVSESCRCFAKQCLEREPGLRPTASELLEHKWLAGVAAQQGVSAFV